jgi:hypothetical protein
MICYAGNEQPDTDCIARTIASRRPVYCSWSLQLGRRHCADSTYTQIERAQSRECRSEDASRLFGREHRQYSFKSLHSAGCTVCSCKYNLHCTFGRSGHDKAIGCRKIWPTRSFHARGRIRIPTFRWRRNRPKQGDYMADGRNEDVFALVNGLTRVNVNTCQSSGCKHPGVAMPQQVYWPVPVHSSDTLQVHSISCQTTCSYMYMC